MIKPLSTGKKEKICLVMDEKLQMCNLDFDSAMLLKEGHDEIMQTECNQEYGYPSCI